MQEEWVDVVGFETDFMISSYGNVFSKRTNKNLKITISKTGYATFSTRFGGRKGQAVCFKIHRLVAMAFIPNPDNKPTVNHRDGNKLNNRVENLEWATYKEQSQHAISTGLANYSHQTIHTDDLILKIISEIIPYCRVNGERNLCRKYGISRKAFRERKRKLSQVRRKYV